jgi:hypothetical protein
MRAAIKYCVNWVSPMSGDDTGTGAEMEAEGFDPLKREQMQKEFFVQGDFQRDL